jgi:hypothetical protein
VSAEIAMQRSAGPTPKRSLMSAMVLVAASWVMATPLGLPVEPEV